MNIADDVMGATDRRPHDIAITMGDERITYGELRLRIEAVAAALQCSVAGPARVAVPARKSPAVVTAMLAVLRAGMSYVPIDVATPPDRVRLLLEDCAAELVLAGGREAESWRSYLPGGVALLSLDDLVARATGAARPVSSCGEDEAYLIYTSGSTGEPKGVRITHRNAAAFILWATAALPLARGDRVAVLAPLQFDLPVYDIYVGLAAGATLCLVPEPVAMFPASLRAFLVDERITCVYGVPSVLAGLVDRAGTVPGELAFLRRLMYAGEEFSVNLLRRLRALAPNAQIVNLYGPVETNVVTWHRVRDSDTRANRIPIGRSVDGALVRLLGDDGDWVTRPGTVGQLVVSGDCVTPGYHGRPAANAAAFVDLDCDGDERRFYQTGDFASWDEEGLLRFHGRRDGLVKVRGVRVELGEVEAMLTRHPDVSRAAVVVVPHPSHTNVLHAFVTLRPGASVSAVDLRAYYRVRLPRYLVPHQVEIRDRLPTTATGKIARRELVAALATERAR